MEKKEKQEDMPLLKTKDGAIWVFFAGFSVIFMCVLGRKIVLYGRVLYSMHVAWNLCWYMYAKEVKSTVEYVDEFSGWNQTYVNLLSVPANSLKDQALAKERVGDSLSRERIWIWCPTHHPWSVALYLLQLDEHVVVIYQIGFDPICSSKVLWCEFAQCICCLWYHI